MMIAEPAALAKAESLLKFAQAQGSPLNTFLITLTHQEAMDLLDFYEGQYCHVETFMLDLAEARRSNDPWLVLSNFQLFGLEMAPRSILH